MVADGKDQLYIFLLLYNGDILSLQLKATHCKQTKKGKTSDLFSKNSSFPFSVFMTCDFVLLFVWK